MKKEKWWTPMRKLKRHGQKSHRRHRSRITATQTALKPDSKRSKMGHAENTRTQKGKKSLRRNLNRGFLQKRSRKIESN